MICFNIYSKLIFSKHTVMKKKHEQHLFTNLKLSVTKNTATIYIYKQFFIDKLRHHD